MLDFSILIGFWRRSDMPRRIQRKRTRGWVKPEGVRVVDRTTIFGNPYKVGEPGVPDQATAVRLYERDLLAGNLRGYRRPMSLSRSRWFGTSCVGLISRAFANSTVSRATRTYCSRSPISTASFDHRELIALDELCCCSNPK
jgi:hypothetical protein